MRINGLVGCPPSMTLAELKDRPRREVDFTLERSGNTGLDFFIGGIGNARWAGTPLAPLLRHADVLRDGNEVVFWGADRGEVTIRDNSGVLRRTFGQDDPGCHRRSGSHDHGTLRSEHVA